MHKRTSLDIIHDPQNCDRNTYDECKESDDSHKKSSVSDYESDESDEKFIESNVEISSLHSMLTSTSCSDEESFSNSTSSTDEDSNDLSERSRSIMKHSNSQRNANLKTSFSTLEIREYTITLGDNPGGCQGPPITLDWDYNKNHTKVLALEDYENRRPPRRCKSGLYVPDHIRMCLLERTNSFSLEELQEAAKDAELIRMQRRRNMQHNRLNQALSNVVHRFRTEHRRTSANTKINAQYCDDRSKILNA